MPRYAFRVNLRGGRHSDNLNMVSTYKEGASHIVYYSCGTPGKAKKLAKKQNDASWFLGEVDDNDRLIKK